MPLGRLCAGRELAGGFIFTGATQMAEPVDWMRRRIESVDNAYERFRRGDVRDGEVCARCRQLSIVVNYDRRCQFCDLMRFMFVATEATRERWTLFGMCA